MADENKSTPKRIESSRLPAASRYMGMGIEFALSILLCLLGGRWLDEKLSSSPLFLILGTLLGAAAGFYTLYRSLVSGQGREQERESE